MPPTKRKSACAISSGCRRFSPTRLAYGVLTIKKGYWLGSAERAVPPSCRTGSPKDLVTKILVPKKNGELERRSLPKIEQGGTGGCIPRGSTSRAICFSLGTTIFGSPQLVGTLPQALFLGMGQIRAGGCRKDSMCVYSLSGTKRAVKGSTGGQVLNAWSIHDLKF